MHRLMIRGIGCVAFFVGVLGVSLTQAQPKQKQRGKPVPVLVSWSGTIENGLVEKAKPFDFVTNRETWQDLWKTWRLGESAPFVNFDECVVLIALNRDPNRITVRASLDDDGNLEVVTATTLKLYENPTSKAYQLAVVPRKGVKTVKGEPITR